MHPLIYGTSYGFLMAVDLSLFAWHGNRPMWWVRRMVSHRFSAPVISSGDSPTKNELMALMQATQRHPERTCYLSLSSKYSPWCGTYFFNEVKVLVGDQEGTHPVKQSNGYGIPLSRFEEIIAKGKN